MNMLSEIFRDINNGQNIVLEKDRVYDVCQDDSFINKGYFCSNTARQNENPDGLRFSAIYLKNKKDIVIDGNGAEILIHGKMTPILMDRCENITVKNLVIDYAAPTMTEFTVTEINGDRITIKINDDCLWRVDKNVLYWHGETGLDGRFYWENASNEPKRYVKVFDPVSETSRDFDRNQLAFSDIEIIGENTLICTLKYEDAVINKGDIFQTRNIIRDQVGSMFERCKNLRFENLRVRFMHGLGMVNQNCENISFINCDFTPKDGRTIASTADFFQFSGCKGKILIENCKAQGAQDDYINVHGTHLRIIEADRDNNTLLVRFMHHESWGFQAFEIDDELEFIRWDTLKPYNSTKVVSFEKVNDTDILLRVTFVPDGIIPDKDVVENITWTPDLYVRNCSFGPTSGRGILATTRGEVIIENNTFRNLWGPALLIEDDCNFWFESGYTKNITFRNNNVICCSFNNNRDSSAVIQFTPKVMNKDSEIPVHGNLKVYNNRFSYSVHKCHTFHLEYLENAKIYNNYFDSEFQILKNKCGEIICTNNVTKYEN